MRRALLVAALLAATLPTPTAEAAGPQWWGPTAIGQGFHLRIPVTVTNGYPFAVTDAPVAADIDLAAKLSEAGWPHRATGGSDFLMGFHLDPNSVRVVAMTATGGLRAPDPIPSTYVEGSLAEDASFNPSSDPRITVLFRVAERLEPGAQRHYMVYVDSDATSPDKPKPAYEGLPAGEVDSLFWSSPGVALYGYVRPQPNKPATVQVTALHADTTVHVLSGSPAPGSGMAEVESFTLGALGTKTVGLPAPAAADGVAPGAVAVKVLASAPVVAQGTSSGFVPSLDGGMAGRDFVFALRHEANWEQDSVYFTRTGDADTVVRVQRINDGVAGQSWQFPITAAIGPQPYTIGARATFDASCNPGQGLLTPGPGLYRATVVSGDRVLLQLQSTDALSQVPTSDGATTGTEFWAATGWSDGLTVGGQCTMPPRPGRWVASGAEADSSIRVTSPYERDVQVYPPGSPGNPAQRNPPPEPVPAAPRATTSKPANFPDRPLLYEAAAPVRLFVGLDPQIVDAQGNYPNGRPQTQSSSVPAVNGPLGGADGGRIFTGIGSALVFAPFPDTVLDVTVRTGLGESRQPTVPVAKDGTFLIRETSASDPVRSFSLRSTRPVLVYPLSATGGFFSGVPAFLPAAVGAAEFRGYVLDLAAKNGLDPLFGSTTPGQPATHNLVVRNLARDHLGQPLEDTVSLSIDDSTLPDDWTAHLVGIQPGSSLTVGPGQQRDVQLVVTPPAGALDKSQGQVRVKAVSLRSFEQSVSDTLLVSTFVKSSVGVGLWFDFEGNPRPQKTLDLASDGNVSFLAVVKNLGSKLDPIRLDTTLTETGWKARLLVEGAETDVVRLEANESAEVVLEVQAPADVMANGTAGALADITIRATSGLIGSAWKELLATAQRIPPSDLVVDVPETFQFADPGGNATFNVTLTNRAAGSVSARVDARGSTAGGWRPPVILESGRPLPSSNVSIDGNGTRLQVSVQAPANASAGLSTALRFSVRAGDKPAREAILHVRVRAIHAIEAILPNLPLALSGVGQEQEVEARLRNAGNLDEVLNVTVADLPPTWNLTVPGDILLPVGDTQTLRLGLRAPSAVPEGLYNVTIRLTAEDGNVTLLEFPTQVGVVARQRVAGVDGVPVQPGELATVEVPVTNEGNVPLRVTLAPSTGDPWKLRPLGETLLQPGENATLLLAWEVPAGAPDGGVTREARLVFASDGGGSQTQAVTARFDVGRPDLAVAEVTSVPGPAGTLVQATLRNHGTRPAHGFDVDLMVGGRAVDRAHVGELPANGTVVLSLLQTEAGEARVVADAAGKVVESVESNNARGVSDGGGPEAPALHGAFAALAVALAFAWRRRRDAR